VAVSLRRRKNTGDTQKRRKDTVLWQLLEHNVVIVATLAQRINADKGRGPTHTGLSAAQCVLSVAILLLCLAAHDCLGSYLLVHGKKSYSL